jgi:hypothetical protein
MSVLASSGFPRRGRPEETIALALRFVPFTAILLRAVPAGLRAPHYPKGGKTFPSGSATISKSFKA